MRVLLLKFSDSLYVPRPAIPTQGRFCYGCALMVGTRAAVRKDFTLQYQRSNVIVTVSFPVKLSCGIAIPNCGEYRNTSVSSFYCITRIHPWAENEEYLSTFVLFHCKCHFADSFRRMLPEVFVGSYQCYKDDTKAFASWVSNTHEFWDTLYPDSTPTLRGNRPRKSTDGSKTGPWSHKVNTGFRNRSA
jgi:hypothetical protein